MIVGVPHPGIANAADGANRAAKLLRGNDEAVTTHSINATSLRLLHKCLQERVEVVGLDEVSREQRLR